MEGGEKGFPPLWSMFCVEGAHFVAGHACNVSTRTCARVEKPVTNLENLKLNLCRGNEDSCLWQKQRVKIQIYRG